MDILVRICPAADAARVVAQKARLEWSVDNGRQAGVKVEAAKACNANILRTRRSVS